MAGEGFIDPLGQVAQILGVGRKQLGVLDGDRRVPRESDEPENESRGPNPGA